MTVIQKGENEESSKATQIKRKMNNKVAEVEDLYSFNENNTKQI